MEARSDGAGLCSAPPLTAQLAGARKQDRTNSRGVALVGVARSALPPWRTGAPPSRPLRNPEVGARGGGGGKAGEARRGRAGRGGLEQPAGWRASGQGAGRGPAARGCRDSGEFSQRFSSSETRAGVGAGVPGSEGGTRPGGRVETDGGEAGGLTGLDGAFERRLRRGRG